MHIDTLRVFCDLADTRSFSKTAEHHLLSQSAVSQQLAQLELAHKCQLITRKKRPIELTPAGQVFYKAARDILERYEQLKNEPYLVELDEKGFLEYCQAFRTKIVKWNEDHRNKFNWNPADDELRKIFLDGTQERKISMCYDAYKILHEKIHYPELVLRALQLMLKASEKTRIANPYGWMWTCLHGNGDGTTPWVQLLTADEESVIGNILRKRTTTSHPP